MYEQDCGLFGFVFLVYVYTFHYQIAPEYHHSGKGLAMIDVPCYSFGLEQLEQWEIANKVNTVIGTPIPAKTVIGTPIPAKTVRAK